MMPRVIYVLWSCKPDQSDRRIMRPIFRNRDRAIAALNLCTQAETGDCLWYVSEFERQAPPACAQRQFPHAEAVGEGGQA